MEFDDGARWAWRLAPPEWRRAVRRVVRVIVVLLVVGVLYDIGPSRPIANALGERAGQVAARRFDRSVDVYQERIAPALQRALTDAFTPDSPTPAPAPPVSTPGP